MIVIWWPRTCVLEARSERSNFEGPPIPWKSSLYFHFFWSKLAMQVVLCVERLTIFSIWCYIMEEACKWATAMTGTSGFLGESSWGPLILCFLTASTDKSYLATSTFDSKVSGLKFPSGVDNDSGKEERVEKGGREEGEEHFFPSYISDSFLGHLEHYTKYMWSWITEVGLWD